MDEKYSVDRIEDETVVLIDKNRLKLEVKKSEFKGKPKEGDVVGRSEGGFAADADETAAMRRELNDMLDRMLKKTENALAKGEKKDK